MDRLLLLLIFTAISVQFAPAYAQEAVFEIPELNAGLGPAPDRIDRRTPRAAMASFIRAANDDDWAAAAHLLNLNDLAADRQAVDGPDLAHQLYDVIDRKAVLDWSILIGRPDALQSKRDAAPLCGEA